VPYFTSQNEFINFSLSYISLEYIGLKCLSLFFFEFDYLEFFIVKNFELNRYLYDFYKSKLFNFNYQFYLIVDFDLVI